MLPNCCLHIPRLLPFALSFNELDAAAAAASLAALTILKQFLPTNQQRRRQSECVCVFFRKVKLVTSANNWVCSLEQLLPFT